MLFIIFVFLVSFLIIFSFSVPRRLAEDDAANTVEEQKNRRLVRAKLCIEEDEKILSIKQVFLEAAEIQLRRAQADVELQKRVIARHQRKYEMLQSKYEATGAQHVVQATEGISASRSTFRCKTHMKKRKKIQNRASTTQPMCDVYEN